MEKDKEQIYSFLEELGNIILPLITKFAGICVKLSNKIGKPIDDIINTEDNIISSIFPDFSDIDGITLEIKYSTFSKNRVYFYARINDKDDLVKLNRKIYLVIDPSALDDPIVIELPSDREFNELVINKALEAIVRFDYSDVDKLFDDAYHKIVIGLKKYGYNL